VCGQYCASVHAIVTGANIFPPFGGKVVNELCVPHRLAMTHVAHVSSESVGVSECGPFGQQLNIIE